MPNKSFKASMAHAGKLLKKLPFRWVVGLVGTFATVALSWMLTRITLDPISGIILTILFILGTIGFSLIIQVSALGAGELLEWRFGRKLKITTSKIAFDYRAAYPKNGKRQFYLEVYNNELWYTAKEVSLIWGEPAVSSDVANDVIRRFNAWNNFSKQKEHSFLRWANENQHVTHIRSNKSKDTFLFELDADAGQFCIQSLNRGSFYFSTGGYLFVLHVHARVPKRYSNFSVYVDVDYRGGDDFEIKSISREDTSS